MIKIDAQGSPLRQTAQSRLITGQFGDRRGTPVRGRNGPAWSLNVKRDYWTGSRGAWRASAAYTGRDLGDLDSSYGPGALRNGYFAVAAALVTVAAGSVGATVLAMSLMAGDPSDRTIAPEQAVRASVASSMTGEPQQAADAAAPTQSQSPTESPSLAATPAAAPVAAAPAPPPEPVAVPQQAQTDAASMQAGHGSPPSDDVAALDTTDPRWAQGAKPAPPIETLRDQDPETTQAFDSVVEEGGEATAAVGRAVIDDESVQDPDETAAISAPPKAKEPKVSAAGGRTTTLNTASNLRSNAKKGARIIGTVPAGASVQLVGCDSWCEIIYKGKRGFVYSSFVSKGAGSTKATSVSQRQKAAIQPKAAKAGDTGYLPGVQSQELPKLQPADRSPSANNRG